MRFRALALASLVICTALPHLRAQKVTEEDLAAQAVAGWGSDSSTETPAKPGAPTPPPRTSGEFLPGQLYRGCIVDGGQAAYEFGFRVSKNAEGKLSASLWKWDAPELTKTWTMDPSPDGKWVEFSGEFPQLGWAAFNVTPSGPDFSGRAVLNLAPSSVYGAVVISYTESLSDLAGRAGSPPVDTAAPGAVPLGLAPNWEFGIRGGAKPLAELDEVLGKHVEPRKNTSVDAFPEIYKGITLMMPHREALAKIGYKDMVPSRQIVSCPGYPQNSFYFYNLRNPDKETPFNRIVLITDSANKVVAVELAADSPNVRQEPNRPDNWLSYDFVTSKQKASTRLRVRINSSGPVGPGSAPAAPKPKPAATGKAPSSLWGSYFELLQSEGDSAPVREKLVKELKKADGPVVIKRQPRKDIPEVDQMVVIDSSVIDGGRTLAYMRYYLPVRMAELIRHSIGRAKTTP